MRTYPLVDMESHIFVKDMNFRYNWWVSHDEPYLLEGITSNDFEVKDYDYDEQKHEME